MVGCLLSVVSPSGGWDGCVRNSLQECDRWLSYAGRDFVVILAVAISCFAAAVYFNLSEHLARFASIETFRAEEIVLLSLVVVGALIFSLRRNWELSEAVRDSDRLARRDDLTGLANRRHFLEKLNDRKARLQQNEKFAVFLLDLDGFKPLNDLYGHRLGDEVLRATGARLEKIIGDGGLVARIGGDEFGILLPEASDGETPLRVARRILNDLSEPIKLAALSLKMGVSVGIATCSPNDEPMNALIDQDGSAIDTVMRQADMGLYQAKREGGNNYQFFKPEMDEQLRQRVELEREIGPAIQNGHIVPYYQPLIDLRSRSVIGCEVLARWEHPSRGLLPPSSFIQVAEATGNINQLTYALLRQAIEDTRAWPETLTLSLNLSPLMIANRWLSAEIMRVLTECSFPAHRLELEITETLLIEHASEARAVLTSLRNLGVSIALDDFGTGHAGLSYLRDFEFDRVKIDRSFVTGLLSNRKDLKLVATIIEFCHTLGLKTTAEGIESFELRDRLTALGCDVGQGYVFCKPKPSREIARYLEGEFVEIRKAG